jgi:CRP/FNR family cyclic AMP-dependent transcriptional regulator
MSDGFRNSRFFERLDGAKLAVFAGAAQDATFDGGDLLFHRGAAADRFYVIDRGSVALETYVPGAGPFVIETIGAGDVLGWSWLFPPYRWHFDARAVDFVAATAFDGRRIREACERDAELGYELMQRFARVIVERLQFTRLRLVDVYGKPAR